MHGGVGKAMRLIAEHRLKGLSHCTWMLKKNANNDTGEEPESTGSAFASPGRPGGAPGHPRGATCPLHAAQLGTV